MLEGTIADFLQSYAAKFFVGFSKEQISLALFTGTVTFNDLILLPSAVNTTFFNVDLPLVLKAGIIRKVQIKVVSMRGHVEVTVEGVDLICAPMVRKIHQAEALSRITTEIQRLEFVHARMRRIPEHEAFAALHNDVVSKITVKICGLHFRIENDVGASSDPFSISLQIREFSFGPNATPFELPPFDMGGDESSSRGKHLLGVDLSWNDICLKHESPATIFLPSAICDATRRDDKGVFSRISVDQMRSFLKARWTDASKCVVEPFSGELRLQMLQRKIRELYVVEEATCVSMCLTLETSMRFAFVTRAVRDFWWWRQFYYDSQIWPYLHTALAVTHKAHPRAKVSRWESIRQFVWIKRRMHSHYMALSEVLNMRIHCKAYIVLYKKKFNGSPNLAAWREKMPILTCEEAARLAEFEMMYSPELIVQFRIMAHAELKTEMALSTMSIDDGRTTNDGSVGILGRELTRAELLQLHHGYGLHLFMGLARPRSVFRISLDILTPRGISLDYICEHPLRFELPHAHVRIIDTIDSSVLMTAEFLNPVDATCVPSVSVKHARTWLPLVSLTNSALHFYGQLKATPSAIGDCLTKRLLLRACPWDIFLHISTPKKVGLVFKLFLPPVLKEPTFPPKLGRLDRVIASKVVNTAWRSVRIEFCLPPLHIDGQNIILPAADGMVYLERARIAGFLLGTHSVGPMLDNWLGKHVLRQICESRASVTDVLAGAMKIIAGGAPKKVKHLEPVSFALKFAAVLIIRRLCWEEAPAAKVESFIAWAKKHIESAESAKECPNFSMARWAGIPAGPDEWLSWTCRGMFSFKPSYRHIILNSLPDTAVEAVSRDVLYWATLSGCEPLFYRYFSQYPGAIAQKATLCLPWAVRSAATHHDYDSVVQFLLRNAADPHSKAGAKYKPLRLAVMLSSFRSCASILKCSYFLYPPSAVDVATEEDSIRFTMQLIDTLKRFRTPQYNPRRKRHLASLDLLHPDEDYDIPPTSISGIDIFHPLAERMPSPNMVQHTLSLSSRVPKQAINFCRTLQEHNLIHQGTVKNQMEFLEVLRAKNNTDSDPGIAITQFGFASPQGAAKVHVGANREPIVIEGDTQNRGKLKFLLDPASTTNRVIFSDGSEKTLMSISNEHDLEVRVCLEASDGVGLEVLTVVFASMEDVQIVDALCIKSRRSPTAITTADDRKGAIRPFMISESPGGDDGVSEPTATMSLYSPDSKDGFAADQLGSPSKEGANATQGIRIVAMTLDVLDELDVLGLCVPNEHMRANVHKAWFADHQVCVWVGPLMEYVPFATAAPCPTVWICSSWGPCKRNSIPFGARSSTNSCKSAAGSGTTVYFTPKRARRAQASDTKDFQARLEAAVRAESSRSTAGCASHLHFVEESAYVEPEIAVGAIGALLSSRSLVLGDDASPIIAQSSLLRKVLTPAEQSALQSMGLLAHFTNASVAPLLAEPIEPPSSTKPAPELSRFVADCDPSMSPLLALRFLSMDPHLRVSKFTKYSCGGFSLVLDDSTEFRLVGKSLYVDGAHALHILIALSGHLSSRDGAVEAIFRGSYPTFAHEKAVKPGSQRTCCCWKNSKKDTYVPNAVKVRQVSDTLAPKERWKRWAAWSSNPSDAVALENCYDDMTVHAMLVSVLTRRARDEASCDGPFVTVQREGICEAYGSAHLVQLEEVPEGFELMQAYAEELAPIVQRKAFGAPRALEPHGTLRVQNSVWVCGAH
eukprot:GEMP01000590.1.p1 GENE.GEMP01000590.1~~GEMP01000590.1.p1  ORF type:complete len:1717 (-),score=390.22 GEMP01000590.1:1441-6591(-)